jgi:NTE family protein
MNLSVSIDTLDKVPFSSSGTLLFMEATAGRNQLGASSDFERYRLAFQSAWSLGRNYFYLGGEWGATRASEDQGVLFSLGGFLRLSGLAPDQLTGQQMGLAKVIYARKLGLGGFGTLPLYLGTSMEYGGAWQEQSQVNWSDAIFAGSAFIAADTFLGAVYLAGGFAEGNRYSMYLVIGREF